MLIFLGCVVGSILAKSRRCGTTVIVVYRVLDNTNWKATSVFTVLDVTIYTRESNSLYEGWKSDAVASSRRSVLSNSSCLLENLTPLDS